MAAVIIRGGTVVDPANGRNERADVLTDGTTIAAVEPNLDAPDGAAEVDATGRYVVPGLIDLHAHVFWGVGRANVDADAVCLPSGVTTVVDGGSCGSSTYPGFARFIQDASITRVLAFINLSQFGLVGGRPLGELLKDEWADPEGTVETIRDNPGRAVGIKLRLEERAVGPNGLELMKLARETADEAGVPLMVHICGATRPLKEFLRYFAAGDIVTHMMTDKGEATLEQDGELLPEVEEARARGVVFDIGHGRSHFPWSVAERMLARGFGPDTISSDVTTMSVNGPVHDLATVMTKFLHLGMPFADVVKATTATPAAVLDMGDQIGSLSLGSVADIAVLDLRDEPIELMDTTGEARISDVRVSCTDVMRSGDIVKIAER